MKRSIAISLIFFFTCLLTSIIKAQGIIYDFSVDNICYDIISQEESTVAAVGFCYHIDECKIPEEIEYNGYHYDVTQLNEIRVDPNEPDGIEQLREDFPYKLTIPGTIKKIQSRFFLSVVIWKKLS